MMDRESDPKPILSGLHSLLLSSSHSCECEPCSLHRALLSLVCTDRGRMESREIFPEIELQTSERDLSILFIFSTWTLDLVSGEW